MEEKTMKKNSFIGGALVSTMALIMVKIIGVIYIIPFKNFIGEKGGALYGYAYTIYAIFLSISSAGFPFAVSKLTSEYLATGNKDKVSQVYKISRNIIFALSLVMFLLLFLFAKPIASTLVAKEGSGVNTLEDIAFVLRLVSFAILVVPFLSVTRGFLQGHKIITPGSISQVIEQFVRVIVLLGGCYLALNVFHMGLTMAVGISVFAACVGGLFSLLYLQIKLHRSNLLDKKVKVDSKETIIRIIKQLSIYAIPYVIISVISNLYEATDMYIVQNVMTRILQINGVITETVSSVFTTYGGKFNGIILALIIGLNTSLTPNIVTSYTKNDMKDVNDKINTSLGLILFVIVPLTIFISVFAKPLWTSFYGYNETSISVYKYFVFYALFGGIFTVIVNILQGLSKYKEVIISSVIGLIINAVLDAPFMLLFHKLGFIPAAGAIVAGLLAYTVSITYAIVILKKRYQISFRDALRRLGKFILPWLVFLVTVILINQYIPSRIEIALTGKLNARLIQIVILGCAGCISFGIYLGVSYMVGATKDLFGLDKIPFLKKKK